MKVVWRLGSATVRDVHDVLRREHRDDLAYTTVLTMMRILEQKGMLSKSQDAASRGHRYTPARTQRQMMRVMVREFVDRVFDGAADSLVAHLVVGSQALGSRPRGNPQADRQGGLMSASTFVVTWVLQSTVLGLVALLLPAIFRLRDPRALASWWGYSAGGIVLLPVLPLFLPRQPAVPMPVTTFVETTTAALAPVLAAAPTLSPTGLAGHALGRWCARATRLARHRASAPASTGGVWGAGRERPGPGSGACDRARCGAAAVCRGARACRRGGRGRTLRLRLGGRLRARSCRVA